MEDERENVWDKMMTWGPAATAVLAVAVIVGFVLWLVFGFFGEDEPEIIFEGVGLLGL